MIAAVTDGDTGVSVAESVEVASLISLIPVVNRPHPTIPTATMVSRAEVAGDRELTIAIITHVADVSGNSISP